MVQEIQNIDDFAKIIGDETAGLVVVDFYAEWCGPCKKLAPFFEQLAKKYPTVGFYKLNVDVPETAEISESCLVKSLPTFCFFMEGKYLDKIVGADRTGLENFIVQHIAGPKNELFTPLI